MVGLMVTSSKRTYANMPCLQGLLLPVPLSLRQVNSDPRLHRRPSNTNWNVWHHLLWRSLLLSPGCWCTKIYLCVLQESLAPFLLSYWGFFFVLEHGVSIFGGLWHSPVDDSSAAGCKFAVLTGEDERTSFYSAILNKVSPPAHLMY